MAESFDIGINYPLVRSDDGRVFVVPIDPIVASIEYVMAAGVLGDVAEFGCYMGNTAQMLACALHNCGIKYQSIETALKRERSLWLFDSFEGFPTTNHAVDFASPHIKDGLWYAGQPAGGNPDEVHRLCSRFLPAEHVHVIKGWYKDTLSQIPKNRRFALLHIDCDYYESAFQVLDHLFTHAMVSDGCTILFDDWYCNRGSPMYGEQAAWRDACVKHKIWFSEVGAYGVVGQRVIVHVG